MLKKRDEPGDESLFSWSTVPRRVFVHGFPSWFLSATGVAVPFRVDGDPNGENMRFCGTSEDSTQSPHLQRPSEGLRYVGMVRGRLTQSHLKSTKSSLKPTLVSSSNPEIQFSSQTNHVENCESVQKTDRFDQNGTIASTQRLGGSDF